MIRIYKNSEPRKLKEFKLECESKNGIVKKGDYDRFRNNCRDGLSELQETLFNEQNGLCCYCMVKLTNKNISNQGDERGYSSLHIEHFLSKGGKHGDLSLSYENLLACCKGRDGNIHFCGHKKSSSDLSTIPNLSKDEADDILSSIEYNLNGELRLDTHYMNSVDQNTLWGILDDINSKLNLNNEILVEARKRKLDTIIEKFNKENKKNGLQAKEDFIEKLGFISYYGFIKFIFLKNHP